MIFYDSFYDAIKGLPDDQRLQCYDAIIAYAVEGKEPQGLGEIPKMVFTIAKPMIDANNERRKNGAKGGRPRKDANPSPKAAGKFINFTPSDTDWDESARKIMAVQK